MALPNARIIDFYISVPVLVCSIFSLRFWPWISVHYFYVIRQLRSFLFIYRLDQVYDKLSPSHWVKIQLSFCSVDAWNGFLNAVSMAVQLHYSSLWAGCELAQHKWVWTAVNYLHKRVHLWRENGFCFRDEIKGPFTILRTRQFHLHMGCTLRKKIYVCGLQNALKTYTFQHPAQWKDNFVDLMCFFFLQIYQIYWRKKVQKMKSAFLDCAFL